MQNLADISFELLLETGLAASGDTKTLIGWKRAGNELPEKLANIIGQEWIDSLMIPKITTKMDNPSLFIQKHADLLLLKIQKEFGGLQTFNEISNASIFIICIALHLARCLGANPKEISEHWIKTAKSHGAKE